MLKKIAKNAIFLSGSQVIARLIAFFYFILLARVLGVTNFGIYIFTLSFIYNFIPVADFGLERIVLRDISRKKDKAPEYFQKLLPLRFLLSAVAVVAALVLGILLGQPRRQIFYFTISGFFLIPYSLTYFLASFQNAREKMRYMAIANVATIGSTAVLGILFVLKGLSLEWVLAAYLLGNSFVALIFLWRTKNWGLGWSWKIDGKFCRRILSQSWVFAGLTILAVFYLRITVILLGVFKGSYLTGLYGSAFKFIESLILMPQSLALALFPLSSRLFIQDKQKLRTLYQKGVLVLLLFSLPLALFLIIFSELIIRIVFGQQYLLAAPALSILGLALILFFINSLAGNIIQNSPKAGQFLLFLGLKLVFGVVLGLILISRWSIIGASWTVVGGELLGVVINNLFVWKILRK